MYIVLDLSKPWRYSVSAINISCTFQSNAYIGCGYTSRYSIDAFRWNTAYEFDVKGIISFPQYGTYIYITRTKFQNFNVSRLVLQLSLTNPLNPVVKSRMKV